MNVKTIPKIGATLAAVAIWVAASSSTYGVLYFTPAGAQVPDGSVAAEASITLGAGTITIDLTDLLANPRSVGQTLSGISFNVTGLSGSPSLSTASGIITTVQSGGSYTPSASAVALSHWGVADSVNLSAIGIVGHQPYDLIVGPDDKGMLDGSGKYSNANKGFANFNPYVLGTAHFVINAPGVTADSVLSDVTFEFGTEPTFVPVPEPTTMIAALLLLLPFGASTMQVLRRNRA